MSSSRASVGAESSNETGLLDLVARPDTRAKQQPRNGHVFVDILAMTAVVAAMVGMHQHMCAIRQCSQQTPKVAVIAFGLPQIPLTHPAIVVTRRVHGAKIDKRKVRFVTRDVLDRNIRDLIIAFMRGGTVTIPGIFQHLRPADVA